MSAACQDTSAAFYFGMAVGQFIGAGIVGLVWYLMPRKKS